MEGMARKTDQRRLRTNLTTVCIIPNPTTDPQD